MSLSSRRAELVRELAEVEAQEDALIKHGLAVTILRLRKAADKTQDEISSAAGILRTTLCNIETEKQGVTLEVLCRVASAFNVEPWEVLRQALET